MATALLVTVLVLSPALFSAVRFRRDVSEFHAACSSLSLLPTACRLEPLALADPVGAKFPRASAFAKLTAEKGLTRFDSLLLAAAVDGGAVGGLHLMRGHFLEQNGNLTDAMCDFQAGFARGAAESNAAVEHARPGADAEAQSTLLSIDRARVEIAHRLSHEINAGRFRRVLREWRFEHDHHSTAIEGNTLSGGDVRALVEGRLCSPPCDTDAATEVLGVDVAFAAVASLTQYLSPASTGLWAAGMPTAPPMSLDLLRRIHKHVLGIGLLGGTWRDHQVFVGDYKPPAPEAVPALMLELETRWHSPAFLALHPVVQSALAHFDLVWVHPFTDGNGRTARLLSSYLLMRNGYPPLNILMRQRKDYYAALRAAHPPNGGCSRLLSRLFAERLLKMSTDLCDGLSRIPDVYAATIPTSSLRADELAKNSCPAMELRQLYPATSSDFCLAL